MDKYAQHKHRTEYNMQRKHTSKNIQKCPEKFSWASKRISRNIDRSLQIDKGIGINPW